MSLTDSVQIMVVNGIVFALKIKKKVTAHRVSEIGVI